MKGWWRTQEICTGVANIGHRAMELWSSQDKENLNEGHVIKMYIALLCINQRQLLKFIDSHLHSLN